MRAWLFGIVGLMLVQGTAIALPDPQKAAPHCRIKAPADFESFDTGYCLGVVSSMITMAKGSFYCSAEKLEPIAVMHLVAEEAHEMPEKTDLGAVTLTVLMEHWPCKPQMAK